MCSRFSYCHGGGGYLSLYFLAERQEIKGRQSSLPWYPVDEFPSGAPGYQGQAIQPTRSLDLPDLSSLDT